MDDEAMEDPDAKDAKDDDGKDERAAFCCAQVKRLRRTTTGTSQVVSISLAYRITVHELFMECLGDADVAS
uniref:Uncharacterized protein n=1 Tax=Peronospora matthiolae TaxID=2874970 RepID=A0AAV1TPT7_9STRA